MPTFEHISLFIAGLSVWLFWPILCIIFLLTASYINDKLERASTPYLPIILVLFISWCVALQISPDLITWKNAAWFVGAYTAIGFVITLFNWRLALLEFQATANKIKASITDISTAQLYNALKDCYRYNHSVEQTSSGIVLRADPDRLRIWWMYWPFYTLRFITNPIRNFFNALVSFFRGVFNQLGNYYKVKV
jgi:hypothetical protein